MPSGNREIRDNDPPTNICSRPNGVIIDKLSNGHIITVMDRDRTDLGLRRDPRNPLAICR
jgi:hypothetical protein